MSNDSYAHPKGNNSRGHLQAWLIEEKEAGVWVRVRIHRGKNGPKVRKGQRVRILKGKELRRSLAEERRIPMSRDEIEHTLGW